MSILIFVFPQTASSCRGSGGFGLVPRISSSWQRGATGGATAGPPPAGSPPQLCCFYRSNDIWWPSSTMPPRWCILYDASSMMPPPWKVLFPENTRKKCPLETYKILIKSISDESYTPHTPSFGDGGNRYTSFGMGLTPSKYRQKIKNWNRVWRNCDLGDESSMRFGSFGDEWGRHGSEWAHTLGKRRHGLQEGF